MKTAKFTTTFSSEDSSKIYIQQLEKRKQTRHEHLVRLLKIDIKKQLTWCSSSFTVTSTYEHFNNSLQKEMFLRNRRGVDFSAQEMLRVTYDLIDVLCFLQENGIVNSYINPTLIYLQEDFALRLPRVRLLERLNMSKDKRSNLISALASNYEIYMDPFSFEWQMKSSEALPNPFRWIH